MPVPDLPAFRLPRLGADGRGEASEVASAALGQAAPDALARSGRIGEALPLAEDAVGRALAAPPALPATADALAMLAHLATLPDTDARAAAGEEPAAEVAVADIRHAARDAAQKAHAIEDPAERAVAEAYAAMQLTVTSDPGLMSEATALAGQALQDARGIQDPGERASALGWVAKAYTRSGESTLAASVAAECLTATAAARRPGIGDAGGIAAICVLVDIGHLTDALAGIGSLRNELNKAAALRAVAERVAGNGQTADLQRLASDTGVWNLIADPQKRISALTGVGLVLAQAGETAAAGRLAEEAADLAGELTENYEQALAHADQAELLAALGRGQEAVQQASQALAVAREPIGGWRGQIMAKSVKVLVGGNRMEDAVAAATSAPASDRPEIVATVAAALFEAGQQDRAFALVSDGLAAVRATGSRSAFYDLVCTHLPKHPDLFRAWLGREADLAQIGRELAAIEQWWA